MRRLFRKISLFLTATVLMTGAYGVATINAAEAAAPTTRTITVTGRGKVTVKPNIATVTLGVQTDNADAKAAQTANNAKIQAVIDKIKALGIAEADIKTANYHMYPRYDYEKNDAIIGYTVNNSVSVTVRSIEKTGEVVDAGVAAGANTSNNIQFSLSDAAPYYEQALNAAIANARTKGAAIAKALGVTVGLPSSVAEIESYDMPVARAEAAMDQAAGAARMPVQVGELEVTAAVQATFTY